ncbi:hypothetical protein [Rosistilla oblonga]|uniref:hypothetical protein n=1 Tax=Rosistilla oblonga TaxID=2527990 RepID=UPI003A9824B4
MTEKRDSAPSTLLQRFFSGVSESIFHGQLGVVDVQLVDYINSLLIRFVRTDMLHTVRRATGRPATEVVEMLIEADKRIGVARREVHRHVGDFTLFWSGMYPESLRQMKSRDHADHFVDYCQQGKRAYAIASSIEGGDDRPPCDLLRRLSEQFEMCAYGLREVRRELENRDGDPPHQNTLLF